MAAMILYELSGWQEQREEEVDDGGDELSNRRHAAEDREDQK